MYICVHVVVSVSVVLGYAPIGTFTIQACRVESYINFNEFNTGVAVYTELIESQKGQQRAPIIVCMCAPHKQWPDGPRMGCAARRDPLVLAPSGGDPDGVTARDQVEALTNAPNMISIGRVSVALLDSGATRGRRGTGPWSFVKYPKVCPSIGLHRRYLMKL